MSETAETARSLDEVGPPELTRTQLAWLRWAIDRARIDGAPVYPVPVSLLDALISAAWPHLPEGSADAAQ